jgi:hypothetical protein
MTIRRRFRNVKILPQIGDALAKKASTHPAGKGVKKA